jgi:VWFA-related protein
MISVLPLWLCLLTAQKPPETTIRTTTRLVHVNVVVRDRAGNPVAGLKQEDFEIADEGVPQQIRFFSAETSEAPPSPPPAVPEFVFSNQRARGAARPGTVTAILFDSLNTALTDLPYARQRVEKFIASLQPADRVAFFSLGNELEVLHNFGDDPARLVKTFAKFRPPFVQSQTTRESTIARTLQAMETIAHHVSGFPGRKNLVWVSSAFPLVTGLDTDADEPSGPLSSQSLSQMRNFADQIRHVALILNNADLAIYPVDARGLLSARPAQADANIYAMQEIARRTGGRAFFERNDLDTGIRQVIDGSRVSYALGYYPSAVRADWSFHPITVRVRRPGLTVHCRKGYYDPGDFPQDIEYRKGAVRVVLAGPMEANGLALNAHVTPAETRGQVRVELRINAEDLNMYFGGRDDFSTTRLDIAVVPMDNHHVSYLGTFDPFTVTLDQSNYEKARRTGLWFRRTLDCHKKATLLKIVVRDRINGVMGSVTVPLSAIHSRRTEQQP